MFDRDVWRQLIAEHVAGFVRNPRQELQLAGQPSLLSYLIAHTFEPFLDAFQQTPIAAVLTLAAISQAPGADLIVQRATRLRYRSAPQLERDLRASYDLRVTAEQLLIELQTLQTIRQRLNSAREEWLRATLEDDLSFFPNEFHQLRRIINDPAWQTRYEALRTLRARAGHFTPADLVLIHDGLNDSAAHIRSIAAQALGTLDGPPPALLTKTLLRIALYDRDAKTRNAAARAIGVLRSYIISPYLLDQLSASLFDEDSFVRSAGGIILSYLGPLAGAPILVKNLTQMLDDSDPYAREAAARALGQIGKAAASPEVIAALMRVSEDEDVSVHEAAVDALTHLNAVATEPVPFAIPAQ